MTAAEGWTEAVRARLRPGRLLPLGAPEDGAWLAEQAAEKVLRQTAERVPGVVPGRIRVGLADPGRAGAPAVPPPPAALPPGPLRIEAEFAVIGAVPLAEPAGLLRRALFAAAGERLGLRVAAVDLRITDLLDVSPEPAGERTPTADGAPPVTGPMAAGPREAGTDTAGTAGTGEAGTGAAGTDAAGTDTAGTGTASTDTAGTDTAGTGTASTDTAGTDTAGTDTASTDTAGTDTAGTDTASTDTAGTDTAGTDTASTDTAGTGTARAMDCAREPGQTAATGPSGTGGTREGLPDAGPGTDSAAPAGAVAAAAAAAPGVARLTGALGAAVRADESSVRVECATAPGHRPVEVARAVRAAVVSALPSPLPVTVLVTEVGLGE
ncbi:hypothetical protein SSP531S_27810 [Streptomyces spongiicola]|uniref:Nucleopolyhedrovirus P10 family protein n=1 Tax=Streptomyces spongiicola TaxID=1690221 RepID=A0A388SXH5_9ACTN|nr:hypothetical protein [Streptomyces spongiicola]GBQ01348.1 hypothetical protein SSP531S_27810 [Streptomyces spongiicola]